MFRFGTSYRFGTIHGFRHTGGLETYLSQIKGIFVLFNELGFVNLSSSALMFEHISLFLEGQPTKHNRPLLLFSMTNLRVSISYLPYIPFFFYPSKKSSSPSLCPVDIHWVISYLIICGFPLLLKMLISYRWAHLSYKVKLIRLFTLKVDLSLSFLKPILFTKQQFVNRYFRDTK